MIDTTASVPVTQPNFQFCFPFCFFPFANTRGYRGLGTGQKCAPRLFIVFFYLCWFMSGRIFARMSIIRFLWPMDTGSFQEVVRETCRGRVDCSLSDLEYMLLL